MNHNYYYTLLGRRAGGPGSAQTSGCSASVQLRYMYTQQVGGLTGAGGDSLVDWEGLVFGNIVEVYHILYIQYNKTLCYYMGVFC